MSFIQAYPSLKSLGSWTRDLVLRVDQFEKWASTAHPPVIYWMSAFTFPTGYLTAVLQTSARQNNVSITVAFYQQTQPESKAVKAWRKEEKDLERRDFKSRTCGTAVD